MDFSSLGVLGATQDKTAFKGNTADDDPVTTTRVTLQCFVPLRSESKSKFKINLWSISLTNPDIRTNLGAQPDIPHVLVSSPQLPQFSYPAELAGQQS